MHFAPSPSVDKKFASEGFEEPNGKTEKTGWTEFNEYNNGRGIQCDRLILSLNPGKLFVLLLIYKKSRGWLRLKQIHVRPSQGIATTSPLLTNDLQALCASFPTAGTSICIPIAKKCKPYQLSVDLSDTCRSIAQQQGVSWVQAGMGQSGDLCFTIWRGWINPSPVYTAPPVKVNETSSEYHVTIQVAESGTRSSCHGFVGWYGLDKAASLEWNPGLGVDCEKFHFGTVHLHLHPLGNGH
ncbi:hypothetical protein K504DRAFT_487321 [Pleomassaria siparia CBS 279.74]|uniref:Uncharacterized protein n=1 Tax=Pleomassaria siparia CBS 279.74 TaxID=1314801 RepID=A0A6G1KT30_9PLEO|nr:hypothetical protein K504DRAFT_487321 [Pleomassaria siparia CBS 279.74]